MKYLYQGRPYKYPAKESDVRALAHVINAWKLETKRERMSGILAQHGDPAFRALLVQLTTDKSCTFEKKKAARRLKSGWALKQRQRQLRRQRQELQRQLDLQLRGRGKA